MSGRSITEVYRPGTTGEIAGSASAAQMPSVAAKMVNFKAAHSNAGRVYISTNSGVTVPDGTGDATAGWPLDAGEETGFLPCNGNLNTFHRICDNAGDDLIYMTLI
jgi:hypothetical protein